VSSRYSPDVSTTYLFLVFGFGRPVLRLLPLPVARAIDPVVLLDPAPGKPFHVMAHTWRHLLCFLASCSNTRVEASPAAMTTETNPRLRVVLHFLRVRTLGIFKPIYVQ
jgi:hypothetical protein